MIIFCLDFVLEILNTWDGLNLKAKLKIRATSKDARSLKIGRHLNEASFKHCWLQGSHFSGLQKFHDNFTISPGFE